MLLKICEALSISALLRFYLALMIVALHIVATYIRMYMLLHDYVQCLEYQHTI